MTNKITQCKHPSAVVVPDDIEETVKNGERGFKFTLNAGTLTCRRCQAELPFEDMALYSEANLSVGIPTEIMEKSDA